MKRLLTFALMLCMFCLLTGCSVRKTVRTLDAAEEKVEQKIDAAEDAVEKAVRDAVLPTQSPATDRLTPEEAQEIALTQAGFTADQVSYLRTEFDQDDRIPKYEVSFREGPWEYEYEIHAETGEILSWEKDD
ncbi:MAG: PepSY domain-containing protein [Oscillospiraceae bacterium]